MLSKLLKHEFIATGHYFGVVYFVAAIAVVISAISVIVKSGMLAVLSSLALMIIALAFIVVTLFFLFISFNKTLYGDQGYLTFTLPVKTRDLLFSKFFVAVIWFLLSYASAFALIIWAGEVIIKTAEEGLQASASESQFSALLDLVTSLIQLPNRGAIIGFCAIAAVVFFISCLLIVSVLFMSITIGNTRRFQKHNVIWSLLFTGVTFGVCSKITESLKVEIPYYANLTNEGISFTGLDGTVPMNLLGMEVGPVTVNLTGALISLVFIVLMCVVTSFIMKNKINIK